MSDGEEKEEKKRSLLIDDFEKADGEAIDPGEIGKYFYIPLAKFKNGTWQSLYVGSTPQEAIQYVNQHDLGNPDTYDRYMIVRVNVDDPMGVDQIRKKKQGQESSAGIEHLLKLFLRISNDAVTILRQHQCQSAKKKGDLICSCCALLGAFHTAITLSNIQGFKAFTEEEMAPMKAVQQMPPNIDAKEVEAIEKGAQALTNAAKKNVQPGEAKPMFILPKKGKKKS